MDDNGRSICNVVSQINIFTAVTVKISAWICVCWPYIISIQWTFSSKSTPLSPKHSNRNNTYSITLSTLRRFLCCVHISFWQTMSWYLRGWLVPFLKYQTKNNICGFTFHFKRKISTYLIPNINLLIKFEVKAKSSTPRANINVSLQHFKTDRMLDWHAVRVSLQSLLIAYLYSRRQCSIQ